jgi:hypothetical protein
MDVASAFVAAPYHGGTFVLSGLGFDIPDLVFGHSLTVARRCRVSALHHFPQSPLKPHRCTMAIGTVTLASPAQAETVVTRDEIPRQI